MMFTKRPLKGPLSQTVWETYRIWLISFAPVDGLEMPDTPTEANVMNLLFEAHFLYDRPVTTVPPETPSFMVCGDRSRATPLRGVSRYGQPTEGEKQPGEGRRIPLSTEG
jgi:hypothetical protein